MSFMDDLLMYGLIGAMGYVAWITKIKPELERLKKEQEDKKKEDDSTQKKIN